jgi:hypothetical protein
METSQNRNNRSDNTYFTCNSIINYLEIIENINDILKKEGCNSVYCDTIKSSCQKIKETIDNEINNNIGTSRIFNLILKIQNILDNNKKEIDKKHLKIQLINKIGEDIIINNNEIVIDKILINTIKSLIINSSSYSHIVISLYHDFPYVMVQINICDKIIWNLNDSLIKDMMQQINGEYTTTYQDNTIKITFQIPIHNKIKNIV